MTRLDNVRLNGHPEHRLPNTLSLAFKNLAANRIIEEIGLEVAVSAGAACHSDTVTLSHVLTDRHAAPPPSGLWEQCVFPLVNLPPCLK